MFTVGVPSAAMTNTALSSADEAVLVHIAGTIAVMPVPFPAFGERGPAGMRATNTRLRSVLHRLPDDGRSSVTDGLRVIRPVVSTRDNHEAVVLKFGGLVVRNLSVEGLAAVVAVCVATLASRFDPSSRSGAELWLDYARRFADRMSPTGQGSR